MTLQMKWKTLYSILAFHEAQIIHQEVRTLSLKSPMDFGLWIESQVNCRAGRKNSGEKTCVGYIVYDHNQVLAEREDFDFYISSPLPD